ncbi:MAG TPA: hypothetical protein VIT65_10745 [Microlunatus sp.]
MVRYRRVHALVHIEWNGERGAESSSTATCRCGWQESASTQAECRFEYREHLHSIGWRAVWNQPNPD